MTTHREPNVTFPLTPTLSLGERENRSPILSDPDAGKMQRIPNSQACQTVRPLPRGEGWGEGEGGALSRCSLHVLRILPT